MACTWRRSALQVIPAVKQPENHMTRHWATTFALTVTNPTTILSFAAISAGLGLGGGAGGYGPAALMVLGVFLARLSGGSCSALVSGSSALQSRRPTCAG